MEERYHIPLVLCCAEENEVALVRVLDELHKEGRAPEVVAGVDLDVDLLARAVDRTDGPALFVLCQSDELDRAATRRLAGLFSARKAPEHRIVTVQLTPQRPLSILPPIRTALKELVRAQYERDGDGGEDRVLLRDVVGPTPVTAVDRKGPDPEELARRLHKEMLAAEALLDKRGKARGGSRAGATATATAAARRRTPEAAYGGEPGAPRDAMEDEAVGMPSLLPALERVPEVVLATKGPDVVQTDFTPTNEKVPRRSPAAEPRPRSVTAQVEEKPGNRVLLFVAIAGITALALMAVLHMSGDEEPAPREPGSGKAVPTKTEAASSKAAPTEAPPSKQPPESKATPPDPPPADDPPEAAEGAEAAPPPSDPPPAADEGGAADAAEGDAGAREADARSVVPPPPRTDNEAFVIDRAIADGKIRSLDALLVLKAAATETMTWGEAADHCRGRAVSDIRGWHLPSTAEVKRLRRSRMLGAATYWTRSRNAAKDEAYALDNRSGRVNLYLTVERVARPICVRNR